MTDLNSNKTQFCLGISKPLNIFDESVRRLINYSLEKKLYIHTSLSYPINFFFIKYLLKKNQRNKINFICKILADTEENFIKTIHLTQKKYGIKKIHIIQLINLPFLQPGFRNNDNLNFKEFRKILDLISDYKKRGIIDKVYLQILSKDNLEFCKKLDEYLDGFAFYANLNEIVLRKDVFEFIIKKNIPSIILSVFGNQNKKVTDDELHMKSYKFSQSFFTKNTIAVGRTLNINRLVDIVNLKIPNKSNYDPVFLETEETQDTAQNFFRRYRVTTLGYIFVFIIKCLIKKIIGKKFSLILKLRNTK